MSPASRGVAMKQYLLSVCYPAGGSQPPPAALNKIMSDVIALQREMQSAGVWVFSGGLHASMRRYYGLENSRAPRPHPLRYARLWSTQAERRDRSNLSARIRT